VPLAKAGITLDTFGPVSAQAAASSTNGTPVVYSAYEANAKFNSRDPYRPVRSNSLAKWGFQVPCPECHGRKQLVTQM